MFDVRATKAPKWKVRVRWCTKHRWYIAHFHNSLYKTYGDTIEEACAAFTKLRAQLT